MIIESKAQFCDLIKKIQLVLFDLDNTLIDLKVDWITVKQYFNEFYLQKYGNSLPHKTFSENFAFIEQRHGQNALTPFFNYLKEKEFEAAKNAAIPLWLLNDGLSILKKYILIETQYGIISNNFNQTIITVLNRFNIAPKFRILIGRDNVIHTKPHPEGIIRVLQDQHLLPEKCLFIGDHETDQKAAEKAGVNFVFVQKMQEFLK